VEALTCGIDWPESDESRGGPETDFPRELSNRLISLKLGPPRAWYSPCARARAHRCVSSFLRNRYREESRRVCCLEVARLKKRDRDDRQCSVILPHLTRVTARPSSRCPPEDAARATRIREFAGTNRSPSGLRIGPSRPSASLSPRRLRAVIGIGRIARRVKGTRARGAARSGAERRGGRRRVLRCGSLANDD